MAKVWVSNKCPGCAQAVMKDDLCVLVAVVKVTPEATYGCGGAGKSTRNVRPNFVPNKTRQVWHQSCFPGVKEAP